MNPRPVMHAKGALASTMLLAAACSPQVWETELVVETRLPGASVASVEERVGVPIEGALAGVEGVREVVSESRSGLSQVKVTVEISRSRPASAASLAIREAVQSVLRQLPPDAEPPLVTFQGGDATTTFVLHDVEGAADAVTFAAAAESMRRAAERVPGVVRADILGASRRTREVRIDEERALSRGIATSDVLDALRSGNAFTFPLQELHGLPVRDDVRLSDIAVLREVRATSDTRVGREGPANAVALDVYFRAGSHGNEEAVESAIVQTLAAERRPFAAALLRAHNQVRVRAARAVSSEELLQLALRSVDGVPGAPPIVAGIDGEARILIDYTIDAQAVRAAVREAGLVELVPADGGPLTVQLAIRGPDAEPAIEHADQLETELRALDGVVAVQRSTRNATALRIAVDRERAAELGVPVAEVARVLRTVLDDGARVGEGPEGSPLIVRVDSRGAREPDPAHATVRAATGAIVPLDRIASTVWTDEPAMLRRRNGVREVLVTTELASDSVAPELEALLARLSPPTGYMVDRLDMVAARNQQPIGLVGVAGGAVLLLGVAVIAGAARAARASRRT